MAHSRPKPEDSENYVRLGDVALDRCGMQCQYCSRYLTGELPGYPDLGSDLRWYGNTADYHQLHLHKEDADEFVRRLREYRISRLAGWAGEPAT